MEKNQIEFVIGTEYCDSHGFYSIANYTPIFAVINGEKRFVMNAVHIVSDTSGWGDYDNKKNKKDLERAKDSLLQHDGKYITFHAQTDDPLDFLSWVKEHGYTLEVVRSFFVDSEKRGFTDFHGNCCEYSCAFHYRIYDKDLICRLKEVVSNMKQHIR